MKPILTQTWTFIKKHVFALCCGVVALIAMVLVWTPTGGWYLNLKKSLDSSVAVNTNITTILNHPRTLPLLDAQDVTPKPLTAFPNQQIIDAGAAATTKVNQEANDIYKLFDVANQHVLLTDGLPNPDRDQQYKFRDNYPQATQSILTILHCTTPPTVDDISQRRTDIWDKNFAVFVMRPNGPTGAPEPTTLAQAQQDFLAKTANIDLKMQQERAQNFSIYLMAGFPITDPGIAPTGNAPDSSEIWNAQMLIWVQTDIAKALASANWDPSVPYDANPPTPADEKLLPILQAPIKQLFRVDLIPGSLYVLPVGASPNTPITPVAESDASKAPVTPTFTVSPTGRLSNGMYDVVHFSLTLDVDATCLPQTLQNLCRGQLLTITRVTDVSPVDNNLLAQQGFIYGNNPVVHVTLDMEDIYLRKWSSPLMPDKVKTTLGVALPSATPAAGS